MSSFVEMQDLEGQRKTNKIASKLGKIVGQAAVEDAQAYVTEKRRVVRSFITFNQVD
jgi:hypothetical protein